ncbi:hypothetical protein SLA2020_291250 [Shorea laevis]
MEDEDEIQSQQSEGHSGSPSQLSPPSNGRISVTVASAPPTLSPPQQNTNALALAPPTQQQSKPASKNNGGGGGGREDCWSEGATEVLIEAWGERYLELSRGNLKQKHWKEVAEIVSGREDYSKTPKTDIQCKNRIDTVKKKYKSEKAKMSDGGAPSRWMFFQRLDQLIGPSAKGAFNAAGGGGASGGSGSKVPIGIPVGIRSARNHFHASPVPEPRQQQQQNKRSVMMKNKNQNLSQKVQPRKQSRAVAESDEDDEQLSVESMDSLPPPPEKKAKKVQEEVNSGGKDKKWGNSVRELTQAILKFGEVYEQAESAKLQQLVEMEKQRMKFAKELELQRMQFFMKTQLEISQLKHGRRGGNGNSSNHNSNMNKHNHSDCSN